jgi:hypothetical protein
MAALSQVVQDREQQWTRLIGQFKLGRCHGIHRATRARTERSSFFNFTVYDTSPEIKS